MSLHTRSTSPSIVSEKDLLSTPIEKLLSELDGAKSCGVDEINPLPAPFQQSHGGVLAPHTISTEPVPMITGAPSNPKVSGLAGEDELRIQEAEPRFPGGGDVYHKICRVLPKTQEGRGSLNDHERSYDFPVSPLLLPAVISGVTDGMNGSSDSGPGAPAKVLSDHESNGCLPEVPVITPHPIDATDDICSVSVLASPGLEEVRKTSGSDERWNEYTASVILHTQKKESMIEGIEIWDSSLYNASVDQDGRFGHEMPIPSSSRGKVSGADKNDVNEEPFRQYKPAILEANEVSIPASSRVDERAVGFGSEEKSAIHSNSTGLPQITCTEQITVDAVESSSCGGRGTAMPTGKPSSVSASMTKEYRDAGSSTEDGRTLGYIFSLDNSEMLIIKSLLKAQMEKELSKYAYTEVSSPGTLLPESVNEAEIRILKENPKRCENIAGRTILCRGDIDKFVLPLKESRGRLQRSASEGQLQLFQNILGGKLWYRGHNHESSTPLQDRIGPVQGYRRQEGPKKFANILDIFSCRSELLFRGLGSHGNAQHNREDVDSPPPGSKGEGPREPPQVDGAENDSNKNDPPASTDGNSTTEPTGEGGSEYPGILMPSSRAPEGEPSIPSDSSSGDSAEEDDVPPPMPLYSDDVLNEYLKEMDEIYENIKVNDRLLKSLVRQVFDGSLTMSRFRENAYVSKGAKRVYASLEENSADVKALLVLLEAKLAVFIEKQQSLVKLIVGEINPHTGGFWANHTRLDVPGVPIDNPKLPKQPYYG